MKRNIFIFIFLILAATSFKYRSKTQAGILNPDSRVLIEQTADSSHDPGLMLKSENDKIRGLENQERLAFIKKDTATLSQLWSKALVITNPDNSIETFSDFKTGFLKIKKPITSFNRIIEKITIHDNVAVVMGYEVNDASKNKPALANVASRRFTNVWMKEGADWKLTARQATNISEKQ